MKVSEVLRQGFTQGAMARDAEENSRYSNDSRACQWCFMGAAEKAYGNNTERAILFLRVAGGLVGFPGIVHWNNAHGRTQKEAVALAEEVEEFLATH